MRGLLAALLICTTGISSARAEFGIPVSEETYELIAIAGGIFLVVGFIVLFILDRRAALKDGRLGKPQSDAPAPPLSETEKAIAELTEAFKKQGWK